jgi:hypothetical protein
VSRKILVIILGLATVSSVRAQQSSQPQVKVNVLNVCSPSQEEQKEIASALAKIPRQPQFSSDFEIDRGRSTLEPQSDILQGAAAPASSDSSTANWVRIRHEFPTQATFSMVQYSFSYDPKSMVETLVFRVRDPKDVLEISLEDSASAVTTPAAMLAANTPDSRIKLERFGKSSIVLARCVGSERSPAPDQSTYEPLFQSASAILNDYRGLLGARRIVPDELGRIGLPSAQKKQGNGKAHGR